MKLLRLLPVIAIGAFLASPTAAKMCEVTRTDGTKVFTDKCGGSNASPVDDWCRSFIAQDAATQRTIVLARIEQLKKETPAARLLQEKPTDKCIRDGLVPQIEKACKLGHPNRLVFVGALASTDYLCGN